MNSTTIELKKQPLAVAAEPAIIEFRGVEKTYQLGTQQIQALKGIDLTIRAGEFIAVAGPSGSGKSSLLNLVALIDEPTKGKVLYDGTEVEKFSDNEITHFRSKKIGIVFQNYNLIPVLSAVENVAFPLQIQSVSKTDSIRRAKLALREVGLGDYFNHRPANLSGGQRQRVAIARALVTNPEIVIADEPTAALDSKTGMDIIELMQELNGSKNTTFIFSTHDTQIISKVNHVIELHDGLIVNA
ncbi:MAG: ABC transporter ATP-binding protein [Williamsia sp.]|nr:ABC transporter ATP-binding protein [Williamsia sp.]